MPGLMTDTLRIEQAPPLSSPFVDCCDDDPVRGDPAGDPFDQDGEVLQPVGLSRRDTGNRGLYGG